MNPINNSTLTKSDKEMQEFYIAPRGSCREVEFLLSRWDLFLTVKRELKLPNPGVLFVPNQCYDGLTLEFGGIPFGLDNGAFQILKKDFDRSLTIADEERQRWFLSLASSASRGEYRWFALPDVPVHGRSFVGREERIRRIYLSAELHSQFLSFYEKSFSVRSTSHRAVVQGYEPEEYLLSYNLLQHIGVLSGASDVVAVGSVCVRKSSSITKLAGGKARGTSEDFLDALFKLIPRRLHLFGLHGKFVRKHLDDWKLYSSDSGAGGAIFKWEIKDLKEKLNIKTKSRLEDYMLSHLIQYVRSTNRKGLKDKKTKEALSSLF